MLVGLEADTATTWLIVRDGTPAELGLAEVLDYILPVLVPELHHLLVDPREFQHRPFSRDHLDGRDVLHAHAWKLVRMIGSLRRLLVGHGLK
jgi:hypothetical protein